MVRLVFIGHPPAYMSVIAVKSNQCPSTGIKASPHDFIMKLLQ